LVQSLFLVYLSISTCFGELWAHLQEKQLCFCNTWYLLIVWMTVWCAGCTLHTRQSSTQNNKYQVLQKHSCFFWWWAHSRPKHVEIDKYTKNKLCTKLILFTRLYRDAGSTKPKLSQWLVYVQPGLTFTKFTHLLTEYVCVCVCVCVYVSCMDLRSNSLYLFYLFGITETENVYYAVRSRYLIIIQVNFRL
jgi:hypothetical protein